MAQHPLALNDRFRPAYWHYLLYLPVILLVLWPLLLVTFPPFLDYYSHLARVHITSNIESFSEFYAINETVPPNIALDVIVRAFLKFVPIEMAGWLFLVSILVLQATGVWVLNRTLHGHQVVPVGPLLGCAILYNSVLTMGFLSYLFGLGLMLWMIWLWMRIRERSWWIAFSVGTGATVLLYFAHLVVLGIYAIVLAGYELQQAFRPRQESIRQRGYGLIKSGIPFLVPILIYVTSFQGDTQLVQYSPNYFLGKLHAIVGTLNSGSSPVVPSIAGLAIAVALAMILGRPKISTDMILPLALLALVFLVAPTTFGGGRYFDDRLALPVALLACASLRVEFAGRTRAIIVSGVLVALLAMRGFDLSRDFVRFDAEVRQSVRLFERIPPRSAVAVAIDTSHPEYSWSARGRANWHVASLAALHVPVFVATTHAQPSQHTMVLKGAPFTDLYAWQKEIPVEVTDGKQLADVVTRYLGITHRAPVPGAGIAGGLYLLLLMPHTLTGAAASQGVIVGKTKWYLLLKIDPNR